MHLKGASFLLAACLGCVPFITETAEHRIGAGSVTAISQFHDVNHHRIRLLVPWKWRDTHPLHPQDVQFGVGVLRRNGDAIQTYSFGPVWRWALARCRCYFEGAASLAYFDTTELPHPRNGRYQDFGYQTEFVTRLSLVVPLGRTENWALGFSFQHISNGGMGRTNPGADFVGAEIERRFGSHGVNP